ncbi:hypothetical protein Scep_023705 [Stephania cephalantha]|uniref:SWIM-type domain-containing protein n=1 Tax=Stephania cephalantha TaxID=152367 RepID=A0AAP0HXR3_9MAGN
MARAAFIRDIFGSSDIEGSSHESLGCEDNSVPLVDEVSISNVIHEQDFNIVSHLIPTVGMSFGSVNELLETYQDHAKEKGFAVVIRSITKDEDGQLKYVWLSCDRGRNIYFEKHSKMVNCPAKVRAIRGGDNRWLVSKFYNAYTRNIFKKVQGENNGMMYYHLDPNNENDTSSIPSVEKFNIKECSIKNWYCKEFSYTVQYRANGQYFDCNCRKFESSGLLCRHIFEVMKMKGIARVHERYIMRRWRKDVLQRHLSIVHSGGYPQMTGEYKKFKEIECTLHEAVNLCTNNPAQLGFLKTEMEALIKKVKNYNGVVRVDQAQHLGNDTCIQDPNHVFIRDPNYVRCRGRLRSNRFISVRER